MVKTAKSKRKEQRAKEQKNNNLFLFLFTKIVLAVVNILDLEHTRVHAKMLFDSLVARPSAGRLVDSGIRDYTFSVADTYHQPVS